MFHIYVFLLLCVFGVGELFMCLISEEEVATAIKGLKIGKAAGPTGVVSEMMKAAGGFG